MNTRIITGASIVTLILLCIYAGNTYIFYLLIAICILGAYELSKLLTDGSNIKTYVHIILSMLPFFLLSYVDDRYQLFDKMVMLSVGVSLVHIGTLYLKNAFPYTKYSYLITLFYWGLPMSLAAYYIQNSSTDTNSIALGVILLIWLSDTMAYFVGRQLGRYKLFPSVSPNKTWEGSIGGGAGAIIAAIIYSYITHQNTLHWICIAVVIWIIGTYGDLVESKIKRYVGAKDSGTILPGHGGILDRFDSLVLVVPFLLLLKVIV